MMPGSSFYRTFISSLKFFDVAANDRMAMQEGTNYGRLFFQGLNSAITVPTPAMGAHGGSGGISGGGSIVNIYINGGDESRIVSTVENAIRGRRTSITANEGSMTEVR